MRISSALAALLAAGLLLAGCGGSDGGGSGTSPPAADPPAVALVTLDKQSGDVNAGALLRTLRRSEVSRQGVSKASEAAPITLRGSRGVTYHYDTTSDAGVKLRTRQVVVVRGATAYTIALTTPSDRFAAANADFASILASWRWAA